MPNLSRFLFLFAFVSGAPTMIQAQAGPGRAHALPLVVLPHTLSICRLESGAPVPAWASQASPFTTVSRTADELSIVTLQRLVPDSTRCERDYRALRVRGPLPLNLVGVLAAIANPLAEAGLSIFAISTFDTDYVLFKAADLDAVVAALRRAGHKVTLEPPPS